MVRISIRPVRKGGMPIYPALVVERAVSASLAGWLTTALEICKARGYRTREREMLYVREKQNTERLEFGRGREREREAEINWALVEN